jgi:hypothetical protein
MSVTDPISPPLLLLLPESTFPVLLPIPWRDDGGRWEIEAPPEKVSRLGLTCVVLNPSPPPTNAELGACIRCTAPCLSRRHHLLFPSLFSPIYDARTGPLLPTTPAITSTKDARLRSPRTTSETPTARRIEVGGVFWPREV